MSSSQRRSMGRLLFPHLALLVLAAGFIRIAVVPAEVCPAVTPHQVQAAAVAAGDWLARGLDEDGRFVYGYDRTADLVSSDYSIVRHGGATVSLFQLSRAADERFREPAESALQWLLDREIETGPDASAIADPGQDARLGTTAFTIVALTERRAISGDGSFDELLRRLGRFVIGQSDGEDGLLAFWSQGTGNPVSDAYGPFATGEALWALAELDAALPNEGWGEAAVPILRYLASGERERREGYLARLPDHWAAYALEGLDGELLDDDLRSYARPARRVFQPSAEVRVTTPRRGAESVGSVVPGPSCRCRHSRGGARSPLPARRARARLGRSPTRHHRPTRVHGWIHGRAADRRCRGSERSRARIYRRSVVLQGLHAGRWTATRSVCVARGGSSDGRYKMTCSLGRTGSSDRGNGMCKMTSYLVGPAEAAAAAAAAATEGAR